MDITEFRINDMRPFAGHLETAEECLQNAHAIATAFADLAVEQPAVIGELNGYLQRGVFAGIAQLIAYASYHEQVAAATIAKATAL